MIDNPELRRNFWLEMTPHRLIGMPLVLGLAFLLSVVGNDNRWGEPTATTAIYLFVAIVLAWGTRQATMSVTDEIDGKTWDTQRMSALTPWQLTWGKLFGANIFTWYGGGLCLMVFAAARGDGPLTTPAAVGLAIGTALLLHASGMLSSLLAPRANRGAKSTLVLLMLVLILFAWNPYTRWFSENSQQVIWFGGRYDSADFGLVTVWLFAAWTAFAAYRAMCTELQVRTTPVAWLAFTVFLTVYLSGIVSGEGGHAANIGMVLLTIGFCVAVAMSALSVWWERRDIVTLRRIWLAFTSRQWRRLLEEMPVWSVTAGLSLICAVLLLANYSAPPLSGGPLEQLRGWAPLGVLLLMLRDIGVLHFFSLAAHPKRAAFATLVCLGLLYGLLPALLSAMNLKPLAMLVLPPLLTEPVLAVLIAGLHVVVVLFLLLRRWERRSTNS